MRNAIELVIIFISCGFCQHSSSKVTNAADLKGQAIQSIFLGGIDTTTERNTGTIYG